MARKICASTASILALLLILKISAATPTLTGPQNNTYVFGRDADVFSINITETDLNTSSVMHHIRVYEAGSTWFNATPACFSLSASEWLCNNTVTGFGSLASDGKVFIYFYDAYDSSGNYGSSGNYFVIIDRSPPMIRFVKPLNAGYVGGLVNMTIEAADSYSGVNSSTVKYSLDNSAWTAINPAGSYYNASWDASSFANNQSVTIYANASDVLGNTNSTYINVFIDNEAPKVFIILPTPSQVLSGAASLKAEVTDQYSGGDNSSVIFSVGDASGSFNCAGTQTLNCTASFVSSNAADGSRTIYFFAKDKAGNSAQNSTTVTVDNLPPSVTIINPQKNSVQRGTVRVNATVVDAGVGTNTVTYKWESSSKTGSWTDMSCTGSAASYICTADWSTSALSDGNYVIKVNATDSLSHSSESSVSFLLDNSGSATTSVSGSGSGSQTTVAAGATTTTSTPQTVSQTVSDALKKIFNVVILPEYLKERPQLIVLIIAIVAITVLVVLFLVELKNTRTIKFS